MFNIPHSSFAIGYPYGGGIIFHSHIIISSAFLFPYDFLRAYVAVIILYVYLIPQFPLVSTKERKTLRVWQFVTVLFAFYSFVRLLAPAAPFLLSGILVVIFYLLLSVSILYPAGLLLTHAPIAELDEFILNANGYNPICDDPHSIQQYIKQVSELMRQTDMDSL